MQLTEMEVRPLSVNEALVMLKRERKVQRLSNQDLRAISEAEPLPARTREWVAQRMWPIVFLG